MRPFREDEQQYVRRLSPPRLVPQWKVIIESGREGCWRKLRAKLDLQKWEEDVARDNVDAPKAKRILLTSMNLTMTESKMDELTKF